MNVLFLSMRVLHILFAAAWLGAAVLGAFFVLPSIQEAGPDGGKVILAMVRRKFPTYIASISGMTVLTGLWLYWRFTGHFDPSMSASNGAKVFGTGGLLGIVAAVIATAGVTRNMKRGVALMAQAASTTDAGARANLMQQAGELRRKAARFGRIVAVLLILAAMFMAVGHYV